MRRIKRHGFTVTLLLMLTISVFALAFTVGCGGTTPAKDPEVTSVTLDKPAYVMNVGDEFTLTATVLPETATNKAVKWSVTQGDAVTVQNGKVTAVKAGSAVVTAVAEDGGANASCAVTVKDKITSIVFDTTEKTIAVGEEFTITPTVTPSALAGDLVWDAQPAGIVKIAGGKVTALAQGTAKVTATDRTGAVKAECAVTVDVPATLTLDAQTKKLNIDESFTLKATVLPETVKDEISWTVEPAGIVSVENGVVTGLADGTATVTASIRGGAIKATCAVTVELNMTITLDVTEKSLHIGDEFTITPTVTPASQASLIAWSVEQTDEFVSVTNGKVTALKEGTAVVKASAVGGKFHAECTVTVLPDNYVGLDKQAHTMYIGDTLQLEEEHTPQDATVVWSINDGGEGVVTVVDGLVTAVAKGTATVTATLQGKDVSASCVFTIKDPAEIESIAFARSAYTLKLSDVLETPVVFTPASSEAGKTVTYTSDHEGVVTVDGDGRITIIAAGKAKITASVEGFTAECDITVNALANDYSANISYDEATGATVVTSSDSDSGYNAIDTGSNAGAYVYYAEVTVTAKQLAEAEIVEFGLGMGHCTSSTNQVGGSSNDAIMFDRLYVNSTETAKNYYHKYGSAWAGNDNNANDYKNDRLGNCYNDIVGLFTQNGTLIYGIARDYDFVYTFINGVIIERYPISSALKDRATFPALHFKKANNGSAMTNIKYVSGDAAKAVIENTPLAFRYSRAESGYKPVDFDENGTSAEFTERHNDAAWKVSITPSGEFNANTSMSFDLESVKSISDYQVVRLCISKDNNGYVWGGGSTTNENYAIGAEIWFGGVGNGTDGSTYTDNVPYRVRLRTDHNTSNYVESNQYFDVTHGVTMPQGKVHVQIDMSLNSEGNIVAVITISVGETSVSYTVTNKNTYTESDRLYLHCLSDRFDYKISNFKFACREVAETPATPDAQ